MFHVRPLDSSSRVSVDFFVARCGGRRGSRSRHKFLSVIALELGSSMKRTISAAVVSSPDSVMVRIPENVCSSRKLHSSSCSSCLRSHFLSLAPHPEAANSRRLEKASAFSSSSPTVFAFAIWTYVECTIDRKRGSSPKLLSGNFFLYKLFSTGGSVTDVNPQLQTKLFTSPLEIRQQIYSYLLPYGAHVHLRQN
jgi:hypothetical protein